MSDISEPSTPREGSASSEEEGETLLGLQIRTFIELSDDVGMEPEAAEDLLGVISEYEKKKKERKNISDSGTMEGNTPQEISEYGKEPHEKRNRVADTGPADEASPLTNDAESEQDGEGDMEEKPQWTTQEVKEMLHHLKERGPSSFVKEYVFQRNIAIPRLLEAFGMFLCPELLNVRSQTLLYYLKVAINNELGRRDRLGKYDTISDAVKLIQNSQNILILTGAGISVSCGIPDFRSSNGLYASIKAEGQYDLDDPQQMFDIDYFKENPSGIRFPLPFLYLTANQRKNSILFFCQIYPSNFIPSPCHRFIKCVEDKGKLLRNYTQNIDTLETLAGVKRVLQCHGSFATASCMQCRRRVPGTEIEPEIMNRKVPLCPLCNPPDAPPKKIKRTRKQAKGQWDSDAEDESDTPEYPPGIMKPDITFFGEKLDDRFDNALAEDRDQVDLIIVIGTSLKVSPVAEILHHLPHSIPQILINKTPIQHCNPDIILLGNADDIILHLHAELGWELDPPISKAANSSIASNDPQVSWDNAKKRLLTPPHDTAPPSRVGNSHVWLFKGAEGGKWLEKFRRELDKQDTMGSSRRATPGTSTPSTHGDKGDSFSREAKKRKLN